MADYGLNLTPIDIDLEYLYRKEAKLEKELWRVQSLIKRLDKSRVVIKEPTR